jgi:hypothetical protein
MAENTLPKKRLSAAEAREIAGPTVDERVDSALEIICAAAEKKLRCVNLTDAFWVNGGYGHDRKGLMEQQYDQAKKALESLGYKVWFFYEERQFVNMYTVVEW